VVLDPVMVATSGDTLITPTTVQVLVHELFPLATVITPNLDEAALLLSRTIESAHELEAAARDLFAMGAPAVLLKGGHLPGNDLVDLLFDGDRMVELPARRIQTKNTHGTGCTLSSAVAALLPQSAGSLRPVEAAVRQARHWLLGAIAHSGELAVGSGHGPVHHFHALWRQSPITD